MSMHSSDGEWLVVEVASLPDQADPIAMFFHERNSRGVVLDDDDPAMTRVTAYFPMDSGQQIFDELSGFLDELALTVPGASRPAVSTSRMRQQDWDTVWQSYFTDVAVGERLMVTPPWLTPDPAGRELIIIQPAEAFGTGTHETTQGCMVLIEKALAELGQQDPEHSATGDRAKPSFLDVGCGTAILAIAAVKLGAGQVTAVDNDPVAVEWAGKNAALNAVETRIRMECTGLEELTADHRADVVAANLDAMTLMNHAARLASLAEKYLIVAGVPHDRWQPVKDTLLAQGLELLEEITRAEWTCGLFKARRG